MDQLVGVADDEALSPRQAIPDRPLLLRRDHQSLAITLDLQWLAGLEDLIQHPVDVGAELGGGGGQGGLSGFVRTVGSESIRTISLEVDHLGARVCVAIGDDATEPDPTRGARKRAELQRVPNVNQAGSPW